jgi:hypothetical protein
MNYKLKEMPEKVYWAETKQFTVENENGETFDIRIGESSKFTEYWIWKDPGGWEEIDDDDLMEYINEQFADDEWEFELSAQKEREEKMDKIIDEYIKENGDQIKIDELVSKISRENLYPRNITFYEEFYHNYHYVNKKIKQLNK